MSRKAEEELTAGTIYTTLSRLCVDKVGIRLLVKPTGKQRTGKVKEGIFDDYHAAANALAKYDGKAEMYFTLNPVYSKANYTLNTLNDAKSGQSITDADIMARRWMLIDIDSAHPKDAPATEREWLEAKKLADEVRSYLKSRRFPDPVMCSSGNGVHLLYRIDLPNDAASHNIIRLCVNALSDMFKTDKASVDPAVHNASRIVRLYGTLNIKGTAEEGRPYRISYTKDIPREGAQVVPIELLERLGGKASENVKKIDSTNLNTIKSIKPGERNQMMTQIAGKLRRAGLTPEEILSVLNRQNQELCEDPLPDFEIRRIVQSATGWECGPYLEDLGEAKPTQEGVESDAAELANELLEGGQFILFNKQILDRHHVGDDALKVLMLYNIPRAGYSSGSINLFHLDLTGDPGTGKNSIIQKILNLLPEENVLALNSVSNKAIYYMTKKEKEEMVGKTMRTVTYIDPFHFRHKVVAITEVTTGGIDALKAATEIEEMPTYKHGTVIDGKYVELPIQGPRVVWTSSVEGLKDRQALDRCWHASLTADTEDSLKGKLGFIGDNVSYNQAIRKDPDVPVAKAGWKVLLDMGDIDERNLVDNEGFNRNCLQEANDFQRGLLEQLVSKGYDNRNLIQFMALCKNIAVIKSFKRGHATYNIEDIREAWWLLNKFQRETVSKLTRAELRILEYICSENDDEVHPRQVDISKTTGVDQTTVFRSVTMRGAEPGKLIDLGYVWGEPDSDGRGIVYEITPHGRQVLEDQGEIFVWNGMVYYPKDPLDPIDANPPRPVTDEDLLREPTEEVYKDGALQQLAAAIMEEISILKRPNTLYSYNQLKEQIVNRIKEKHPDWRSERVINTFESLVEHDQKIGGFIQSMVVEFPYSGFDINEYP